MEEDAGCPSTGANVGPFDGVLGVALLPVVVVEQPAKSEKKRRLLPVSLCVLY